MIRALIFDLGGVVIAHRPDLMPYIIGSVFTVSHRIARDIWHRHKDAILTGELPSEAFINKIRIETGTQLTAKELVRRWRLYYRLESKHLNTKLLRLVDRLRKSYRTYLLTDTLDAHYEQNVKRGIYRHFDDAYNSHLEGKSKSQGPEVFAHFLEKFGYGPGECVFVDDLPAYVKAAGSVGIKGIVYTDFDGFSKKLVRLLNGQTKASA